jgi:Rod binding domain-containing protein
MSSTIPTTAASTLSAAIPPRTPTFDANTNSQDELRGHFTQFVGESFFGQMLKSMRATVGKPAYFHGGRAEEVFQGQLDQHLAEHLTESSASRFADPMFERQFPQFAASSSSRDLNQLDSLRRF